MKKAREEEELNAARRKQIEDQKKWYASEIQREKEESEKIARLNTADVEKSKEIEYKNKMVDKFSCNIVFHAIFNRLISIH